MRDVVSHGKRHQKEFRNGSLRRKIANQQKSDFAFLADTEFAVSKPTELTDKQKLALIRSNEICAKLNRDKNES